MALFKRTKTTFDDDLPMPQELQDYYAAENRSQGWKAWVLGLTTLVVTLVVALGLFYGGRYAYRKISKDNKPKVAQKDTSKDEQKTESSSDTDTTETSTPATDTAPTPPSTPQTSSTSTSTPGTATTPATAGANTSIPNTGPEGTLTVFAAVSLIGYLVHRRLATK